jgi:hypothetical protein
MSPTLDDDTVNTTPFDQLTKKGHGEVVVISTFHFILFSVARDHFAAFAALSRTCFVKTGYMEDFVECFI